MSYTHKVVSGVDIVDIEGSMDLYSVPELKKFCKSLIKDEKSKLLLILKNVYFLDSSGLGMLTNIYFDCEQKKIPIKFANISAEAKRMFALTKLDKKFIVYETVEEAMKALT